MMAFPISQAEILKHVRRIYLLYDLSTYLVTQIHIHPMPNATNRLRVRVAPRPSSPPSFDSTARFLTTGTTNPIINACGHLLLKT
jgi:hypothetical protein